MTVTNNIYQTQIKYHLFNALTNSELTELVPVFTTRPAFPTSVKKVNTSFRFYLEFCLQFRQRVDHKNVVVPEALRQSSAGQTGD
jgi:hypothetical protein